MLLTLSGGPLDLEIAPVNLDATVGPRFESFGGGILGMKTAKIFSFLALSDRARLVLSFVIMNSWCSSPLLLTQVFSHPVR